jgi:hypothetical protein
MRRNGFRVIHKELKTFYDGTRKANLDVEIAVDMLSLAGRYDTAVLVSGDEDFVYAVNAVAYKGCRVEVAGFRSNTAPKLIDVADYFIDLGEIADKVRKEPNHTHRYYENHTHEQPPPPNSYASNVPVREDDDEILSNVNGLLGEEEEARDVRERAEEYREHVESYASEPCDVDEDGRPSDRSDFIRVTDDQ